MEYRVTPRARDDLLNIGRYTEQVWGVSQRDKYLAGLIERINWLAANPDLGIHRPDLDPNYYCYPQGQHIIYYRTSDDAIHIIGVLHKHMDAFRYFDID